jgi:hypothetical protein
MAWLPVLAGYAEASFWVGLYSILRVFRASLVLIL